MLLEHSIPYVVFYDFEQPSPSRPLNLLTNSGVIETLRFLPSNLHQLTTPDTYFDIITLGEFISNYHLFMISEYPTGLYQLPIQEFAVVLWCKERTIPENLQQHFSFPIIVVDIYPRRMPSNERIYSICRKIEEAVIKYFPTTSTIRKRFLRKRGNRKHACKIFLANTSNHFTIAHAIGAFGANFIPSGNVEHLKRPDELLLSIQMLDNLHYETRRNFKIKNNKSKYYPFYPYPVLMLVCPWINYRLNNVTNPKKVSQKLNIPYNQGVIITKAVEAEQCSKTYNMIPAQGLMERIVTVKDRQIFMHAQLPKVMRITANDNLAFLHASFQFSPIYRSPLVGKSLNPVLDYFIPSNFMKVKNSKDYFQRLEKLGQGLGEVLSEKFKTYLGDRNGAICIQSDLPFEISHINDTPLFFSHDVCRIQETPYENTLTEYVKHSAVDYEITEDMIKRTLVVCTCPSDRNILENFMFIKTHVANIHKNNEVRFEICRTKEELSKLVNSFKPELLIFDTHGNFREKELDSILIIEDEVLTSADIVKYQISAPVVILSSCFTAPLSGFINPIAHGFFEAGALTVLSSILPISNRGANILYSRVLNNLRTALFKNMHENWAGFISHCLRTSYFDDLVLYITSKIQAPWIDESKFTKIKTDWYVRTCFFENRIESYRNVGDSILSMTNPKYIQSVTDILEKRENFMPDSFAYTLFGRADLVKFPQRRKLYEASGKEETVEEIEEES